MEQIDGGWRITETETHYIDLMRMMYNWRLCATPKSNPWVHDRGYCYYGIDRDTFLKAALAGLAWEDVLHTDPVGWDKDVIRQRYAADIKT